MMGRETLQLPYILFKITDKAIGSFYHVQRYMREQSQTVVD